MLGSFDAHNQSQRDTPQAGLKELMAAYERNLILTALGASGWNQRRAATTLGVLPTTLLEKMRRLGIKNPRRAAELPVGL
jgi:transcriptional regulator with GAF, ATPase, and Fis domain